VKLAGFFNGSKISYMSKDQGKFDFSYHNLFKTICIEGKNCPENEFHNQHCCNEKYSFYYCNI